MITPSVTTTSVHVEYGGVSQEDGKRLFDYINANPRATIEFREADLSFPVSTGGTSSARTRRTPTHAGLFRNHQAI